MNSGKQMENAIYAAEKNIAKVYARPQETDKNTNSGARQPERYSVK